MKINRKNLQIIWQIAFWLMFVLAGALIFSYQGTFPYYFYLVNFIVILPVYAGFNYLVVRVLIPRMLLPGRVPLFILTGIISMILFSAMRLLLNHFIFYGFFLPLEFRPSSWFTADKMMLSAFWILIPCVFFIAIHYFIHWQEAEKEKERMRRRGLEVELQTLKAQLNPHFLINTLNNLYLLVLNKSDSAPALLEKIASLFRYMLYECTVPAVTLRQEIGLIEDYIALEKLRHEEQIRVALEVSGDTGSTKIPPMLFFPLVENCFKHGTGPDVEEPSISIRIAVKNNTVEFASENRKPEIIRGGSKGGGVGLSNIAKRLQLLYPGRHTFITTEKMYTFSIRVSVTGSPENVAGLN
ncbi:MAG: sensor histidine kinase [Bacteroidota bacterium]